MASPVSEVVEAVDVIARRWRSERTDRQSRRHLEQVDFDLLRDAGLLRLIVPVDAGGFWRDTRTSFRDVCEVYRRLASAEPSVALVSCMHPAVISYWLGTPDPSQPAWEEQRQAVFASAAAGDQWATITSEPGSGGDISRTRAVATPLDADPFLPGESYGVTGDKHFGSGSGIADRMLTTAIPEDEADPTIFVLDVRDRPSDGSSGLELIAEWDGMGMAATQSHAMRLAGAPSVRLAWAGELDVISRGAALFVAPLFTAVILGVLDEAVAVAGEQLRKKAAGLRPFEQVEWARAEQDHWLAVQAYEGALTAVEGGDPVTAFRSALRAKQAVAELSEQALLRLTRVLGGGTFSQRSPFAHWFEDVRALGFLRPPWGLAYDALIGMSAD